MRKTNKFFLLLLLVIACLYILFTYVKEPPILHSLPAAHTQSSFNEWKKFIPQSQKFEVLLPTHPQYIKDLVTIPSTKQKKLYELFVSEKIDGTIFMISVMTYPNEVVLFPSIEALQGIAQELVQSNPHNHLAHLESNVYQTYEAIDFAVENPQEDPQFKIKGKAFLVGQTIYMLTYTAKKENFDLAEYEYFIHSFLLHAKDQLQAKN